MGHKTAEQKHREKPSESQQQPQQAWPLHPEHRDREKPASFTKEDVERAIGVLHRAETRPLGIEQLHGFLMRDTRRFANVLWELSGNSPRKFAQSLYIMRDLLKTASGDSELGRKSEKVLLKLYSVESRMRHVTKEERVYLALAGTKDCCADADAVRARVHAAVHSEPRAPLKVLVFLDPSTEAGATASLPFFLQMMSRANYDFDVRFIIDDLGISYAKGQAEEFKSAFLSMEKFVRRKHSPHFSISKASNMMRSVMKGVDTKNMQSRNDLRSCFLERLSKANGNAILATNLPPELGIVQGSLPVIFLQKSALSVQDTRDKILAGIAMLPDAERRRGGVHALLNLVTLNPVVFQAAWLAASKDSAERRTKLAMVRDAAESFSKGSETRAAAKELYRSIAATERALARERAREIYRELASRQFRGAWPLNKKELLIRIRKAVATGEPLAFTVFWGGYKESNSGVADRFDRAALLRLKAWLGSIGHPVNVAIIFCDLHATALNGKTARESKQYRESLAEMMRANEIGMRMASLSSIHKRWRRKFAGPARIASLRKKAAKRLKAVDTAPLREMAEKHSDLVRRGKKSPAQVVCKYFEMRFEDEVAAEEMFPNSISVYMGGGMARFKFHPERPVAIFAAVERGLDDPPWFLDASAGPATVGGQAVDRNILGAEKLLRALRLDASAGRLGSRNSRIKARVLKACGLLQEAGLPARSAVGAALLYICGDVASRYVIERAIAEIREKNAGDPLSRMDVMMSALKSAMEPSEPGPADSIPYPIRIALMDAASSLSTEGLAEPMPSLSLRFKNEQWVKLFYEMKDGRPIDYDMTKNRISEKTQNLSMGDCIERVKERNILAELAFLGGAAEPGLQEKRIQPTRHA